MLLTSGGLVRYQTVTVTVTMTMTVEGPYLPCCLFFFFLLMLPWNNQEGSGFVGAGRIGFCYGRAGDNLPTPGEVVAFLTSKSITRVRIYDDNLAVIQAFTNSSIELLISIPNSDLQSFQDEKQADEWVTEFLAPLLPSTNIIGIVVGTETITNFPDFAPLLLPALENIHTGLTKAGLANRVRLTTSNSMALLETSFPPSAGTFKKSLVKHFVRPLLEFLRGTGSYYSLNTYPYLSYVEEPDNISLAYALLSVDETVVDPTTSLSYSGLLEAQVDAVLFAMEALGYPELRVVVSETGWPTKSSDSYANLTNAATYNNNVVRRILLNGGTPHRPSTDLDAFIFSLFNENRKTGPERERNWGVFAPDKTPLYALDLTGTTDINTNTTINTTTTNNALPQSVNNSTASTTTSNTSNSSPSSGSKWCIASPSASNESLATGIDWACGQGNTDCSAIQPNGSCYMPDTYANHASFAYNSYYQQSSGNPSACNFSETAVITTTNPSYSFCIFPDTGSVGINSSMSIGAQGPSSNVNSTSFAPPNYVFSSLLTFSYVLHLLHYG